MRTFPKPSRPLLRYHGGKWRLAEWIISHFPKHRVYVEPFGGGASVLLQKPMASTEIYNDADGEVVELFRVLRDPEQAAELKRRLILTPFARGEYEAAYELADTAVERARRTIVKSFMGMGSKAIWRKSGFDTRVNPEGFISRVNSFAAVADTLDVIVERLRRVVIEEGCGLELIQRHRERADALFYVDPPYLRSTYGGERIYRKTIGDEDHRRMGEALREVAGAVVVSGYASDLYDRELFPDWRRVELATLADGGTARTECLWLSPRVELQRDLFS